MSHRLIYNYKKKLLSRIISHDLCINSQLGSKVKLSIKSADIENKISEKLLMILFNFLALITYDTFQWRIQIIFMVFHEISNINLKAV